MARKQRRDSQGYRNSIERAQEVICISAGMIGCATRCKIDGPDIPGSNILGDLLNIFFAGGKAMHPTGLAVQKSRRIDSYGILARNKRPN